MRAHARWVRISHSVILMAHPRLYWGNAGNDLTTALIELPLARTSQSVATSDPFDDGGRHGNIQNGWAWYTGI